MSSRTLYEMVPNVDRTKSRLLFNKDEKAKSLSPPLSAENVYDFDQHLLKEQLSEKLSEKKQFMKKIQLQPSTNSPSVQLPKMPKNDSKGETMPVANLSKDNKTTSTSLANCIASIKSPASSSNQLIDKQPIKRPEIKASKRKSREPVKNITKLKCISPSDITKWDSPKSSLIGSTVSVSSSSSSSSSNSPISSTSGTINATTSSSTNPTNKSVCL